MAPLKTLLLGCVSILVMSAASAADISFNKDVKPIIDRKCVVCHGCYDAPCQLKLESMTGLDRGANKTLVYDGTRTKAVAPTRLFEDASTTEQWRGMGFYSVLKSQADAQTSLLHSMIALGKENPVTENARLPEHIQLGIARVNECPTTKQFHDYAEDRPFEGMPLAVTGLTDAEFKTMETWINAGAPLGTDTVQLTPADRASIAQWETFLNYSDARHFLVARWLYEHLFIAHLYFSDIGENKRPVFFNLVRSRTAPGEPIQVISTLRPNDDPGGPFWYRLRPVLGSVVHKNHTTFALNAAKLERTKQQFLGGDWHVDRIPKFDYEQRANPFVTFAAIPAQARYQFMLDDAEYFIRTFIRGPVCRGQIATDVIRDHFWAIFQEPEQDLFITDAEYRAKVSPLLGLPGQKDSILKLGPEWLSFKGNRNEYLKLRDEAYNAAQPSGPNFTTVWDGDGHNENALLTIFRHHDNSSVRRGLIGSVPRTFWLMDYPLLERSYYDLVANFNVFGNVAHQAQTRLYFDLIRNGSEINFLRLMPPESRKKILNDWYQGSAKIKLFLSYTELDDTQPTGMTFKTTDPKQEFAKRLLTELRNVNATPDDPINRCETTPCHRNDVSAAQQVIDDLLSTVAAHRAETMPMISYMPDVTMLTIETDSDDVPQVFSLVRNRSHSNVAFMMAESLRYQPEQDTLTIRPGILGSYPNFGFAVPEDQATAFITAFRAGKSAEDFDLLVARWGVRRTHPKFWQYLDGYHKWLEQDDPLQSGILDINRYKNL